MLERLLGVGSFGGFIGHLACPHAIFLAFSNGFGFFSIVRIIAFTFLECWALIIFALVIHFQHDDHPILLVAIAHVDINIFPFQMALQDTRAMLP
jgi:hypothetical protein